MADAATIGWGVLSSANIAQKAVIPAIHAAANGYVAALGTPNGQKVRESAERYGYRVLPSYEAVLADPQVTAVYNPLPNGLHAEWTIRALRAGKHVLCEKPMTVVASDTREMMRVAAETGRILMEAFMYRFHPQMALAREVLDSGRLGTLKLIRAAFSFSSTPDPANPRFQADQGPGALLDVGCYCVNAIRFFSGGAPAAVSAWARWDPSFDGDMTCAGVLEYAEHAGLFDCSFEEAGRSGIEVVGSRGRLEIPKPWLPGTDPAVIHVWGPDGHEELKTEGVNHYQLMVEHFGECVRTGRPPIRGADDALENMRVLDAIRRSAREQRRVPLAEVE